MGGEDPTPPADTRFTGRHSWEKEPRWVSFLLKSDEKWQFYSLGCLRSSHETPFGPSVLRVLDEK